MINLFQAARGRRSIRKYQERPVEWEKIEQLLEAARLAPSWKNKQFLVLTGGEGRQALLEAFPDKNPGKKVIATAPVVMVVCTAPSESGVENGIEYYVADTAIAFEHLCLAAHALGLGSCWMGWYDEAQVKEGLGIPEGARVVGITPLGYPDQEPKPRPRKEFSEIAFVNQWGRGGRG